MAQWYCLINGQKYGPISEETLRQWAVEGRASPNDQIWSEGMAAWASASTMPALFAGLPPSVPPEVPGPQLKSKLAAGLLGILVGAFGVHNFYLGYTGKAVAQLLITVLTCGFGAVISSIWGLIEGILILTGSINTDAQGRPLIQ